jgi:Rrf2 family nitric oxide-sensitive transcriptional repressor
MRLTSFTDFGLRALILLAERDAAVTSSAAIADTLNLSRHHIAKVLQELTAAGFIRSVRGALGGVTLALPPDEIKLGAVVRRLEADQPLVECCRADGGACLLSPACRLRGILAGAQEAFYRELDRFTLEDCLSPGLRQILADLVSA